MLVTSDSLNLYYKFQLKFVWYSIFLQTITNLCASYVKILFKSGEFILFIVKRTDVHAKRET